MPIKSARKPAAKKRVARKAVSMARGAKRKSIPARDDQPLEITLRGQRVFINGYPLYVARGKREFTRKQIKQAIEKVAAGKV